MTSRAPTGPLKPAGTLREVHADAFTQRQLVEQFVMAVESRIDSAVWMSDLGISLEPDESLFTRRDGSYKLGKRGRARWIEFLADTLIDPAEVRLVDGLPNASKELLVLGGYLYGGRPLHTLLVYRHDKRVWAGVSGYQIDSTNDLTRYRKSSMPVWVRK